VTLAYSPPSVPPILTALNPVRLPRPSTDRPTPSRAPHVEVRLNCLAPTQCTTTGYGSPVRGASRATRSSPPTRGPMAQFSPQN
jgi:hypothetical protein